MDHSQTPKTIDARRIAATAAMFNRIADAMDADTGGTDEFVRGFLKGKVEAYRNAAIELDYLLS